VYKSDDGPKNGRKLVIFVINCVVYDVTPFDTFMEMKYYRLSVT